MMLVKDGWKDFRIGDLFDLQKGTRLTKSNMMEGDIRFVSAANVNNGVTAYIGNNDHVHSEGTISVCYNGNGGTGKAFYQPERYWASDDVHVLYPRFRLPKNCPDVEWTGLNAVVGLFLAAVIEKTGRQRYGFADKWKLEYMREDKIKLPADDDGKPDWMFMQAFMEEVISSVSANYQRLLSVETSKQSISLRSWQSFKLGEIFEVTKGVRLTKAERTEGPIPYVGASQQNNGITQHIGNMSHVVEGHCLTVCYNGPVGTTFYQPQPFWPTDDVNVLRPRIGLSKEILLFLAPIIESVGKRNYSYVDKWRQDAMVEAALFLPATIDGRPDWDYMESCARNALSASGEHLDKTRAVF